MSKDDEQRDRVWEDLYRKVVRILRKHGKESPTSDGDYWVIDDNYGWHRQIVSIYNLKMLEADIFRELRALLRELPDWSIVLALDVPGTEGKWPPMGVTIRRHEIIDGLQRKYLPKSFQKFVIPGSRPGTGYD